VGLTSLPSPPPALPWCAPCGCTGRVALVGPPPLVGVRDRAERHRHRAARRWRAHPRVNARAGEGAGGGAGHHHPLHGPPWLVSSLDLTRLRVLERKGRGKVRQKEEREEPPSAACRAALLAVVGTTGHGRRPPWPTPLWISPVVKEVGMRTEEKGLEMIEEEEVADGFEPDGAQPHRRRRACRPRARPPAAASVRARWWGGREWG
jgi:hypothetical protein